MGAAAGGKEGAALIAALLGSSLIGGITAPQGQKLAPFRGANNPDAMMSEGKGLIEDMLGSAIDEANQPVTLHTTVNPLPSFKGGGLPMAISAPGMDANRLNPALRTTQPPTTLSKRRLPGTPDYQGVPSNYGPGNPPPGTEGPAYGQDPPPGQEYPSPGPDGHWASPDAQGGGGDPLAAIQLLKSAHRMTF